MAMGCRMGCGRLGGWLVVYGEETPAGDRKRIATTGLRTGFAMTVVFAGQSAGFGGETSGFPLPLRGGNPSPAIQRYIRPLRANRYGASGGLPHFVIPLVRHTETGGRDSRHAPRSPATWRRAVPKDRRPHRAPGRLPWAPGFPSGWQRIEADIPSP